VWDGVVFEVLHPPPLAPQSRKLKPNEVSCVLRIGTPQGSALLAGDIEARQELSLVEVGLRPVDVLLAPHHGSKTSSSLPFLQALEPRIVLVQAGYRNRFGHPAPEVVARYAQQGSQLVESTRCGAATWRSQAPAQVHCERAERQRYWHRHGVQPVPP
jgi:competence protein ComEC